jgi:hypothetical protein
MTVVLETGIGGILKAVKEKAPEFLRGFFI